MTEINEAPIYYATRTDPGQIITWSKPGDWRMTITDGLQYIPDDKRRIPNRFHRFMQRLFFGFKWERVK